MRPCPIVRLAGNTPRQEVKCAPLVGLHRNLREELQHAPLFGLHGDLRLQHGSDINLASLAACLRFRHASSTATCGLDAAATCIRSLYGVSIQASTVGASNQQPYEYAKRGVHDQLALLQSSQSEFHVQSRLL